MLRVASQIATLANVVAFLIKLTILHLLLEIECLDFGSVFFKPSSADLLVNALLLYGKLHICFVVAGFVPVKSDTFLVFAAFFYADDLIRIKEANSVFLATALFEIAILGDLFLLFDIICSKHIVVVIVASCCDWSRRLGIGGVIVIELLENVDFASLASLSARIEGFII
ncbi:hypothetical protein HG530_015858 [Fusarium avenaceum]|nr:hypothetical protein HG530_015858 [Fusarium avenaceum]